jgi:hypothetical protein
MQQAGTGNVLAVGLLRASMNASGRLSATEGGWQFLPALLLLTLAVAGHRRWKGREPRAGRNPPPPDDAAPIASTEV